MTRLFSDTSALDAPTFSLGPALLVAIGVAASLVAALRVHRSGKRLARRMS
jgi:hypothetical protein